MKRIYSIGGGKGGSGKSFVAASLGTLLARQGKKVVLVDLDLGAPNLHTLLVQKAPQTDLDAFISKKTKRLENVAVQTTITDLYLISSTKCSLEIANLFYTQKMKLINAIRSLPFDYVLLDLGPGTHYNTLDFFLIGSEGIFVTTPEPTAIENTFIFVKSLYLRRLKQLLKETKLWHILQREMGELLKRGLNSPLELIDLLEKKDPRSKEIIEKKIAGLRFKLIMNKFRGYVDQNLGHQITDVCNRHLYPNFSCLGNVSYDSRVYEAIFNRHIFVLKYPYTKGAVDLQNITKSLLDDPDEAVDLTRMYHE
jgi:flagellar biosynthesis protein FlhG